MKPSQPGLTCCVTSCPLKMLCNLLRPQNQRSWSRDGGKALSHLSVVSSPARHQINSGQQRLIENTIVMKPAATYSIFASPPCPTHTTCTPRLVMYRRFVLSPTRDTQQTRDAVVLQPGSARTARRRLTLSGSPSVYQAIVGRLYTGPRSDDPHVADRRNQPHSQAGSAHLWCSRSVSACVQCSL